MGFSRRLKFGLFVCGLASVSACATQNPNTVNVQSRGVYDARKVGGNDANGRFPAAFKVEQNDLYNDPLKQHLRARGEVDPVHVNKKNKYTKNVADIETPHDGPFDVSTVSQTSSRTQAQGQPLKVALNRARSRDGRTASSVQARQLQAIAPAAGHSGADVRGLRTGEYPDKTRLVLDLSQKAAFNTRFENGGRVLVVSLPDAHWGTRTAQTFAQSSFVRSYTTRAGRNGSSEVVISLKTPGRLVSKSVLPPNPTYNTHRIVLDVAAL